MEQAQTLHSMNYTMHSRRIENLIKPETELERKICNDPEWIKGVIWGSPRKGHPEGLVLLHIAEVLENVDKAASLAGETFRKDLRLITLIHDSFKYQEDTKWPRDWSKHHAVYARKFAEKYIEDQYLLDIIELHDEAYYAWRLQHHTFKSKSKKRMLRLLERISGHIQLYYLFFKCDTRTGDKTQKPVNWFEQNVAGISIADF